MDGRAPWGIGDDYQDGNLHLAKVRVAGSNPVFRSQSPSPRSPPRS